MHHQARRNPDDPIRLCLFGASPDTANRGVSALFLSVMNGIYERHADARVTVFDHGAAPREDTLSFGGASFRFTRCGANLSRRYYRRDSLLNMRLSAMLGGLGNPGIRAITGADAVFDISGGDSFADLYGLKRFRAMTQTKRLVLDLGRPLVLLPQTYGPFSTPETQGIARGIVRGATMTWARDERSFETLRDLLGGAFDDTRHRTGVDVAFALPRNLPDTLPAPIADWIAPGRTRPVIGLNVSGLIHNRGAEGSRQFGFRGDYRDIIAGLLRRFLDDTDANVILVPHVFARSGHEESDPDACHAAARAAGAGDRLCVLDGDHDAMELKGVISQLDFFCGTRMHSTIAGLSSGVPTSAIAYSKKTLGVFESCGLGHNVTDPRTADPDRCVRDIWHAWETRAEAAETLSRHLPAVRARATDQMDRIFGHLGLAP